MTVDSAQWFTVEKAPNGQGYCGLAVGSHAYAMKTLHEQGFTVVSIAQFARQRLHFGVHHQSAWTGSRTTDLFICQDGEYFLARGYHDSDLYAFDTADFIEDFHRSNQEIPLLDDCYEDIIAIPADNFEIETEDLVDHQVSKFLFGDAVSDYQAWLKEASIPRLPFMLPSYSLASSYPENFVRPLIMRCTDNWSGIITVNADLHNGYGYRASADHYDGPVRRQETFSAAQLALFASVLSLEPREYSVSQLEQAVVDTPYQQALPVLLRVLRNDSALPANFTTWDQERSVE